MPPPAPVASPASLGASPAKAVHEAQLRESGVAEPWKLVEGLSDALLEEVLQSAAQEMFESADAVVEAIVGAEFGDAPKAVAV